MTVEVLEEQELYRKAVVLIADSIGSAIGATGRAMVALSGGKTPKSVYRILAKEYRDAIEWGKVHIFFSDERCVPPDDPESNFKTAVESLISRISIPEGNVHRMKGEIEPSQAAREYSNEILTVVSGNPFPETSTPSRTQNPRFDLVLLGLGEDGHTASIFPGSDVVNEKRALVSAPFVPGLRSHRLTLTPPVIRAARRVILLVAGEAKSEALAQAVEGEFNPERCPAQLVREAKGDVIWLADPAAGARLSKNHRKRYTGTA